MRSYVRRSNGGDGPDDEIYGSPTWSINRSSLVFDDAKIFNVILVYIAHIVIDFVIKADNLLSTIHRRDSGGR